MRYRYFFVLLWLPLSVLSQDGGQSTFSFLDIPHSPREEALGGTAIAVFDSDVSLSQITPSLLNSLI